MPVRVIFGLGTADRKLAGVLGIAAEPEELLARRLVARFSERVAGVLPHVRIESPIVVERHA